MLNGFAKKSSLLALEIGGLQGVERMGIYRSGQRDSNPRHSAWEADALPLSHARMTLSPSVRIIERAVSVVKIIACVKLPAPDSHPKLAH